MPTPKAERFLAWSFSRLQDYRSCPYKAYLKHIKKLREPPNAAMERGAAVHVLAEQVVTDPRIPIPGELTTFSEEFHAVRHLSARETEKQVAFDRRWFPAEWFDMARAWVRVVIDLIYVQDGVLHIVDHKTGRQQAYHEEQLSLYAVAGMIIYPEAAEVHSHLWYLDQGVATSNVYLAEELEPIKEAWEDKVAQMLADTAFEPTPSGEACRWCAFTAARGGPCKY